MSIILTIFAKILERGFRLMYRKLSKWFTAMMTLVVSVIGMAVSAFAINPVMGDETQGTVKLMTVLLIVSAVVIIVLVAMSAMKKKKGPKK